MIRYQKLSSGDVIRPGRSGLISLSSTRLGRHRLEPLAEELRVEPDLERFAGVGRGIDSRASPTSWRLRGDVQLAFREAEAQRRVSLRDHFGAADDLQQLLARKSDLHLERLREAAA